MLRTMTVASGLIIADTVRDLRDRSSAATRACWLIRARSVDHDRRLVANRARAALASPTGPCQASAAA
jgi:hypothetical protein